MQRITRYSLLLKQILHYTPKTHPDHDGVVKALAMSEKAAEMVNNAAKARESEEKLEEVRRVLDLACDEVSVCSSLRAQEGLLIFDCRLLCSNTGWTCLLRRGYWDLGYLYMKVHL